MTEENSPAACQSIGAVINPELDCFFNTLETALTLYKKEAKTDMRLARLISHNKQKRPSNGKAAQPPVPAEPAGMSDAAVAHPTAGSVAAPQPSTNQGGACFGDPVEKLREEIRAQGSASSAALQLIAERMLEVTGATGAVIAIDNGQQVVCCASIGTAPALGAVLQPASGLSGHCMRAAEVVICQDSRRDSRVHPAVRETLEFRSALLAPICSKGKTIGLVGVFSPVPRTFDYLHADTLLLVGELICNVAQGVAEPASSCAGTVEPAAASEPEASNAPSDSKAEPDLLKLAMTLVEHEESELPPLSPETASEAKAVQASC